MQVSTDNNTKRRRTSSSHDGNSILSLSTLPGDHLTTVSSYLAPTSKLLLTCALSAPSTSFSTVNWKGDESLTNESKAILTSMGSTIEVLDFGDVGDLAGKLSDDDIAALLVCIDAKNTLKKLQLTGCNMLVGHGLEHLRESIVLEHIGLHLPMEGLSWKFESILDSIVDNDENSLRVMKVSNIKHAKNESSISTLLKKFHKLMTNGDDCETCVDVVQRGLVEEDFEISTASLTCFKCFRSLCDDCEYHSNYSIRTCSHCGLTFCEDCGGSSCYDCNKFHCPACTDIDIIGAAKTGTYCRCYRSFCLDCIGVGDCESCKGKHFRALKARTSKREEELNGENTQLQSVVSDLTEENEELHREIEELRKKMSPGLGILS